MAKKKINFSKYKEKTDVGRAKREEGVKNSDFKHHSVFETPPEIQKKIEKAVKKSIPTKVKKDIKPKKVEIKKSELIGSPGNIELTDENEIKKKIFNLEGIQQKLFFGLLKIANGNNESLTNKVTAEQLNILSETDYRSTKTSLSRLVNKGLILRYKGKTSINGYYNLGFSKNVYNLAIIFAQNIGLKEFSKHKEAEPA